MDTLKTAPRRRRFAAGWITPQSLYVCGRCGRVRPAGGRAWRDAAGLFCGELACGVRRAAVAAN